MKKVFLLVCCLFLASSFQCDAQDKIYAHNQTNEGVWFALAYSEIGDPGMTWVTESWLFIPAGEKYEVSYKGYDSSTQKSRFNFFYYGFQENGREWRGSRKFIMDGSAPDASKPGEFDQQLEDAHKRVWLSRSPDARWFYFANGVEGSKEGDEVLILRQDDMDLDETQFKKGSFK